MSKPRQIVPGATYMVTRRTYGGEFLLKPTPMVSQIFTYCLAHAANKYNILLHAFCLMSNHYHLVATDPDGRLPDFTSWLNEFVAKSINRLWGRSDYMWGNSPCSVVRLETVDDILDKIVYSLVNPVNAFLVSDAKKWPGATSIDTPFEVARLANKPPVFFRKNGPLPDEEPLKMVVPESAGMSAAEYKTEINARIIEIQEERKAEARQQKKGFFGIAGIRATKYNDSPKKDSRKKTLNPHVASKNGRTLRNALLRLKIFRAEYADALQRFKKGEYDVLFPFGTFALRKTVSVQSIPPPEIVWN